MSKTLKPNLDTYKNEISDGSKSRFTPKITQYNTFWNKNNESISFIYYVYTTVLNNVINIVNFSIIQ